jgi:hypothetical protein
MRESNFATTTYYRAIGAWGDGGASTPPILEDQLTSFQPGGTDYAPQRFSDLLTAL